MGKNDCSLGKEGVNWQDAVKSLSSTDSTTESISIYQNGFFNCMSSNCSVSIFICIYYLVTCDVIVIVIGNGLGDLSSDPVWCCLHFA